MALHPINYISLCTGGAGLDLGIGLAMPGARAVCLVEREAFAVAHLVSAMQAGLLARCLVWSDARTFNGRPWRGIVDGVIGGIPCQPHSVAGKRLAEEDDRDLWSDFRRILVQSGAWWCLIENVRGILSSGGAERVYADLRRLGFDVEAGLFSAEEVGATHQRERLFILAVADNAFRRLGNSSASGQYSGFEGQAGRCGRNVADTSGAGLQGRELGGSSGERHGAEAPRPVAELHSPLLEYTNGAGSFPAASGGVCGGKESAGSWDGEPERSGFPMADTFGGGHHGRTHGAVRHTGERTAIEGAGRGAFLEDAARLGSRSISVQQRRQEQAGADIDRPSLFPPGPNDADGWRIVLAGSPDLEPAVCRVADGMASRVDQLRMLGNGVVPLAAGYAFRTLVTRLARRSTGAAFLNSMMEPAHDRD